MIVRIAAAAAAAALTAGVALAATSPSGPAKPRPSCSVALPTPVASTKPPSQALLDAFGVLERPRTPADTVPPAALKLLPFGGPVNLEAARQIRDGAWLIPLENANWFPRTPERCLRRLPAKQRAAVERAEREAAAKPPEEGVEIAGEAPGVASSGRWRLSDIEQGRTFNVNNCAGAKHDQLTVTGLVPDSITTVKVTAGDGTVTEATPDRNLVQILLPRPAKPAGLPAHVTLGSRTVPLHVQASFTEPCNPPDPVGNGLRLAHPIPLERPPGARIELRTRRWEAEDTLPRLALASYRHADTRCLMIGTRGRLETHPPEQRFCVGDDELRSERYIARVRRLPGGEFALEGFVDTKQVVWVTVERNPGGGARALWPAKRSGAFFLVVRAGIRGNSVDLHAALRGRHARYTALRTLTIGRAGSRPCRCRSRAPA
jgi:hypothetical protein